MTGPVDPVPVPLCESVPDGYFVGGCVRDWLLGRPLKDLDLALPGSVEAAGRAIEAAVGGVFFWLREAMQVGRVLINADAPLQIDLVPLAGSLEEDLRRRDFTINAMAVPAREGLVPGAPVIDPTGGRADLAERRLRLAGPDALERDPLRCLRAFRLRARLGLTFGPGLEVAIHAAAPGLSRISGERIRDELFVLLEGEQSAAVMTDLLSHGLVAPWSPRLAASAAAAGVALLENLDRWLTVEAPLLPFAEEMAATLETAVTPPRRRQGLLRLAALAIEAEPAAGAIGQALCLSADEIRVLSRAVSGAAALARERPVTGSGRLRYARRWEPGAVEAALLTLAGRGMGDEERGLLEVLLCDLLERRLRPAAPLLTGNEVMAICGIPPGPEVGRLLQEVEERRADGELRTPEEACEWLRAAHAHGERSRG